MKISAAGHHTSACEDDSPKNDRFSGFHHPVNFRSHLTSLRNCTKPTRTGACRPEPTVNYPISAHLRSDNPRPQSFGCKRSGPDPYRTRTNPNQPEPTRTNPNRAAIDAKTYVYWPICANRIVTLPKWWYSSTICSNECRAIYLLSTSPSCTSVGALPCYTHCECRGLSRSAACA